MSRTQMNSPSEGLVHRALRSSAVLSCASSEQILALAARSELRKLESDTVLINDGEQAEELFILLSGELVVIKTTEEGEEVVLQRCCTLGDCVGEDASLHPNRIRSASVRVAASSMVAVLSYTHIQQIVGDREFTHANQPRAQQHQRHNTLVGISPLYRRLAAVGPIMDCCEEVHYADGEYVFKQDSPSDRTYFVLSGRAELRREKDGQLQSLGELGPGQVFGELGVVQGKARAASVLAKGELHTLAIDAAQLLKLTGQSDEAADHLSLLRQIYANNDGGKVLQFDEFIDGQPVIVTSFQHADSPAVVVQYALNSVVIKVQQDRPLTATQSIHFSAPGRGIKRRLQLIDSKVIGASLIGPSDETGQIIAAIRDGHVLLEQQRASFQTTGLIFDPTHSPDLACFCMRLTYSALEREIENGCDSVDALRRCTGASTVCGDCRGSLRALVGEIALSAAEIHQRTEIAPGVFRIRLKTTSGSQLNPSIAGQHIIVEGEINGVKVRRPYTLTNAAGETAWREITLRRETFGLFSRWLCDVPQLQASVQITPAIGEFVADLSTPTPILMVVAGIGVTPAIALARSRAAMQSGPQVVIDHSAPTEARLIAQHELQVLADQTQGLHYTTRRTAGGERLTKAAITKLHKAYPDARWMICGPERFQKYVHSSAIKCGARAERVQFERFGPRHADSAHTLAPDLFSLAAGIAATLLTLIGLSIPLGTQAFYAWQASSAGRWWSGAAFICFLAYQWWLPIYRWSGAADHVDWLRKQHRRVGAFIPLLLLLHTQSFGAGMLTVLSAAVLLNTIVGVADRSIVRDKKRQVIYFRLWLFPHILLSFLITGLALYHVWVILAHGGP
jgi:ferredoxin-NADP reductase/CRP-like cAMP-binding protein